MDENRRQALKRAGATGAFAAAFAVGLLRPEELLAADWNKDAFSATSRRA